MNYPELESAGALGIFDSHAHYDDSKYDGFRDELLQKLEGYGVCGVVTCGCDAKSSVAALNLAERYDYIYAAVGIHPCNIDSGTTIEQIEQLARHKKCVAIGEIGLDYYWDKDHSEEQKEIFLAQIELAKKMEKPVIVHDRDAHGDSLEILKATKPKGVLHCFSGSPEMAEEILKLGLYIGVGGVITFKNAKRLPEVVRLIPDDRLLLETDCPYLAPEPYRGKLCHSGLINFTAERVAEIRGKSKEEILEISKNNALKLFDI